MATPQDTFHTLLKNSGNSITKARSLVFAALVGKEPLTMHQVVALTPNIDRASVYRAIELFERLGIVQRLNTGWKYRIELTDKFAEHHHHLTCTQCGKTTAMNETELEQFIDVLAGRYGIKPMAHQIEIQGICLEHLHGQKL